MKTPAREAAPFARGFPPIEGADARVLILGSLPGRRSLEIGQYYGLPANAFWRIMERLFDAGPSLPYPLRRERLIERGVAVWDVLAAGERAGSLDSAIVKSSVVVNDFAALFARQPRLRLVCFNGTAAAELYRRHVLPSLPPAAAAVASCVLPSTSPANATLRFDTKLALWTASLEPIVGK